MILERMYFLTVITQRITRHQLPLFSYTGVVMHSWDTCFVHYGSWKRRVSLENAAYLLQTWCNNNNQSFPTTSSVSEKLKYNIEKHEQSLAFFSNSQSSAKDLAYYLALCSEFMLFWALGLSKGMEICDTTNLRFLDSPNKTFIGVIKRVINWKIMSIFSPLNNLSKYSCHRCRISSSFTKRCSLSSLMHLTWLKSRVFLSRILAIL